MKEGGIGAEQRSVGPHMGELEGVTEGGIGRGASVRVGGCGRGQEVLGLVGAGV